MNDKYERLSKINNELLVLRSLTQRLELEKANLISEIQDDEAVVLNQLPARGKNSLVRYGINSDIKLKLFLMGDSTFIYSNVAGFHKEYYDSKCTYIERLMAIRNIGSGTAKDIILLLRNLDFIS